MTETTAQAWIAAFAARLDTHAPDDETFEALLALAAEAAHSSERIAAPIACYLAGAAGVSMEDAMTAATNLDL